MRIRAQVAPVLFVFIALPCSARSAPPAAWHVAWEPKQPVNGSAVLFRVTAPAAFKSLHGSWSGHEISFRFDPACTCWYAIAGISLEAKAGQYPLQLQGVSKDAASSSFISQVTVTEKRYPTTSISVAPEYVKPPQAVLARIEEEQALKKQVFSQIAPESSWADRFVPPVESNITAVFGSSRTYNGVKNSPHLGLDFRAAVGTTVRAANRGTVILARNLYYEGNCVFIDHGQGLLTLYFHLSEIKVKEGDTIESGRAVGLSGNTGRVTAPHLHFAVRWQGVYVDPETLLALHPPQPAGSRTRPGGTL
jgi:murein DD-endopeptidase MepM/ murein hydrolase activator NlpD